MELDGKNIVFKDSDVQELAFENEDLKGLVSEYELMIENYEGIDLSDLVRDIVGMDDLYVFDGNCKPDVINRMTLDYHRLTQIEPKEVPEGATWEYVIWDYTEHLILDRETENLEHFLNIGTGCRISCKYEIEGGIESLFENFDAEG